MSIFLFVIIRIINTFHKDFAVDDFIGKGLTQQGTNISTIGMARYHSMEIVVFGNLTPIDTFA